MTGFSPETRMVIAERAGHRCELCRTTWSPSWSHHHRRPRGMGGDKRPETNAASNGLLLCGSGTTGCHGRVEANREWALERGLLVSRYAMPAEVPVRLDRGWVQLDDLGNYLDVSGGTE